MFLRDLSIDKSATMCVCDLFAIHCCARMALILLSTFCLSLIKIKAVRVGS